MPKRLLYEEVVYNFHELGYEVIKGDYKNKHSVFVISDINGYYYKSTYMQTKRKQHCFVHSLNPYTIQNINLWCKLNNKTFELISDTYEGNNKKLKWKCLKDDCGEIFESSWNIIATGHGCGFCAGKQVGLSNCLATKNPELAKEWHPTKNRDLTPYDVTCGSHKKVWWLCKDGHEWEAKILGRTYGKNCPYCINKTGSGYILPSENYNLLKINPDLCKQWNYKINDNNPEDYTPVSGKKVWWICDKGHQWETKISDRVNGSECPYCAGFYPSEDYNLLVDNPKLCEEWNYEKNNKKPENYCPKSGQKVWWKCRECGSEWEAQISSRSNGNGCPKCNISKGEYSILNILNKYNIIYNREYSFSNCKNIKQLPFDFYLPTYNILIEYQGQQHYEPVDFAGKGDKWANSNFKLNQKRDNIKRQYCLDNNIKLLEIPYWEFDNIEKILKNELCIK